MRRTPFVSPLSTLRPQWRTAMLTASLMIPLGACGVPPSTPHYAIAEHYGSSHPTERYTDYGVNEFVDTSEDPISTFSIDVDTGSYSLMRRDIVTTNTLPPVEGVRVEEYINYFDYNYPPAEDLPFSVDLESAPSPFGEGLELLRIGIRGKDIPLSERDPANLVFLVDVSGSMSTSNKLGLIKWSLKELVDKLSPTDTLGIVAYAGTERVVLQPTAVENKSEILDALDGLTHGGSTNGEAGIKRAYALARSAFVEGGINRVVLCTDGDFNVGLTGDPLLNLIEEYRDQGVYLTTLGFGMGNYNDSTMEQLADRGNGNYAYIDSQNEALRVLGEKLVSTLSVIAKDVKLQVEFNPRAVTRYRLVGYENRVLENEDFIDDTVDAGEIGAGHRVTAFYELEWATDLPLAARSAAATLKIRYKEPDSTESTEHRFDYQSADHAPNFPSASPAFRFAAAVTEFAEILRQSPHSLGADFSQVLSIAEGALTDPSPIETEFLTLVSKASEISRRAGSR